MHTADLKLKLKNVQYISATCDIWSCKHRSYIAVTVSYIDPISYDSKHFLIAIDRFEGTHDNVAVTKKLKEIFKRFDIHGKVVGVTTDNAGEFVLAFVRYGDNYTSYESYLDNSEEVAATDDTAAEAAKLRQDADTIIISSDSENESDNDDDHSDSLPPLIIETIDPLSNSYHREGMANAFGQSTSNTAENEQSFHLVPVHLDFRGEEASDGKPLPIRLKCAAHCLNSVGKTDAVKALNNPQYAKLYCKVMAKLNLLWKYCGHRKKAELIKTYIGKVLLRPHRIRWNALYDSVSQMLNIEFESVQ